MTLERRARNPETHPGVLQVLAARFPEEVLENPALPLIALTQPSAWASIVGRARAALASRRIRQLHVEASEAHLRRWQLESVGHVLSLCDDEVSGLLRAALDRLARDEPAAVVRLGLEPVDERVDDGRIADPAPAMLVVTAMRHLVTSEHAQAPDACVEAARREAERRGENAWVARAVELEWQADALARIVGQGQLSSGSPAPR